MTSSGIFLSDLSEQFGQIDIYLFDQLLRGRIPPGKRIFDAGCGTGRNLSYLMRAGYEVFAVDADARSISDVKRLAAELAPNLPHQNFRNERLEDHSFPDAFAGLVISSAVLHFARDDSHFYEMLHGAWRTLEPGGLFFCRLASTIGMERQMRQVQGRRFLLPDGTERFLVDAELLDQLTHRLGAVMTDPLKTTLVQDQRSMTTWVLRREA